MYEQADVVVSSERDSSTVRRSSMDLFVHGTHSHFGGDIMYKVKRYRRELRELSEQIGRQQIQVQQQNTNVIVKTTKTPQVEHEIELKTFELNEGSHIIVQSSTSTPTKCKICDSTDHGSRKCPIYNRIKALGCFETNKEVAGQKSKKDESDSEPDDKPLACKGFI